MQKAMQNNCAVFRTDEVLKEGRVLINKVFEGMEDIGIKDKSLIWNSDLIETLEFDNMIVQAIATISGADERTESRGSHAREDFPDRNDDDWMKHTLAWVDEDGKVDISYRKVHDYTLSNDIAYIPPKERVY
jgi:succinate dehydrogenase / fumarate reductase flavoprotein subunit